MTKWTRTGIVAKTSLATSLAVVAAGASGSGLAAYTFAGSDTLTQVIQDSISQAGLSATLTYFNTGSGQGESDALANKQSIVPMSRNFKSSVFTTKNSWRPQLRNVIGLDAGVMVEVLSGTGFGPCRNLFATLGQPNSILSLVLGGVGGVGTTEACRDQRRLDAIDQLAACFTGVDYLEHFYRRDDRSGTSDTFKERLGVDRFCNGRAPGLQSGTTSPDTNLYNDDSDPVRRACIPADATHAKTVCTKWPSTEQCQNTPTVAGCTQGFVVALSERDPDPTTPDMTTSIAGRVLGDGSYRTVGFAGREASRVKGNTAPMFNWISPSDYSVRNGKYFLARRLFVNWADTNTDAASGGAAQRTAETSLYNWMTDPNGDPLPGRFNVDPIMVNHGFLPCTTDSTDPTDTDNLCNSEWPIPAAQVTSKQCIPPGINGNGSDACCSTGATSVASTPCPAYTCSGITSGCSSTAECCSSTPGMTCQDLGTGHNACCVGGSPSGPDYTCTTNAECCSNSCNTTTGKCGNPPGQSCTANADCGTNSCNTTTHLCKCNANADCISNSCNLTTNLCLKLNAQFCAADADCSSKLCSTTTKLCTSCNANADCTTSLDCNTTTHTCRGQTGLPCTANGDCHSNSCDTTTHLCL